MNYLKTVLVLVSFLNFSHSWAQDRFAQIENKLESIVIDNPGLDDAVELSVEEMELQQFIRGIGINHRLNINVNASLNEPITNNFANARVLDVLVFLCKKYELDITLTGSIISVEKFNPPLPPVTVVPERLPEVDFNNQTGFLSLDLKMDTLSKVAKEITRTSFKNVILAPDVKNDIVSVYIQNRPFDDALDKLAFANGLKVTKDTGDFYLLEKNVVPEPIAETGRRNISSSRSGNQNTARANTGDEFLNVKTVGGDRISLEAKNIPIMEVIELVSKDMFKSYFLFDEPEGTADLFIENATYDEFLRYVLSGSNSTFHKQDEVYLIGREATDILRNTELIKLENRAIENVLAAIPQDLLQDLTISEFIELNAFVIRGSYSKLEAIKDFLREIDQPVPSVLIEVLIIDYNKSRTTTAGISAGLGNPPTVSGGAITPNANYNLTSITINDLINSFNGFGLINLGRVTSEFYVNIQAMESDGILKTRSTPKLSTMNGSEASLSIGRTEYYLEETSRYVGTQTPVLEIQQNFRAINADLNVTIKPIVSGNDEVTLIINVQQSDFTERISDTAPPGSVTRNFQSKVRIKNGDMILLGGLESRSVNRSGTGLPLISRIPVLKWIFGKRTAGKSKNKLNIFIKSTVIH